MLVKINKNGHTLSGEGRSGHQVRAGHHITGVLPAGRGGPLWYPTARLPAQRGGARADHSAGRRLKLERDVSGQSGGERRVSSLQSHLVVVDEILAAPGDACLPAPDGPGLGCAGVDVETVAGVF